MTQLIHDVANDGDTIGGRVNARATGVPAGWGAPVFDKFDADLAKACLSLPACKGFEIGSGFNGARMTGSEHNDLFIRRDGKTQTQSNHAGGTLGESPLGSPIVISCAFKPVSTIFAPRNSHGVW